MGSFEEMIIPPSREVAVEYYRKALELADLPDPKQTGTGKIVAKKCAACKGRGEIGIGRGKLRKVEVCGECESGLVYVEQMSRKQSIKQKVGRLMTDYAKNPEIDVWARWSNWDLDVLPLVERLGPLPLPSIEFVPVDDVVQYAATDAHSTKRIYHILLDRLVNLRKEYRP